MSSKPECGSLGLFRSIPLPTVLGRQKEAKGSRGHLLFKNLSPEVPSSGFMGGRQIAFSSNPRVLLRRARREWVLLWGSSKLNLIPADNILGFPGPKGMILSYPSPGHCLGCYHRVTGGWKLHLLLPLRVPGQGCFPLEEGMSTHTVQRDPGPSLLRTLPSGLTSGCSPGLALTVAHKCQPASASS